MNSNRGSSGSAMRSALGCALCAIAGVSHAWAGDGPVQAAWRPIATSRDLVPGTEYPFRSFNQPSINRRGMVVFRARATGTGGPVSGVFMKRVAAADQRIEAVFLRHDEVPQPNNTAGSGGGDSLAGFNEFPSIPRIDRDEDAIATRAQSTPVWTTVLADGSETRVGTSGIYAAGDFGRITGASLLGAVLDPNTGDASFPYYSVPGAPVGTRFDQFPGAPSITAGRTIVFKGNYTDPATSEGRTGIFFRDILAEGGAASTRRIASSDTVIPGQWVQSPVHFGSTAPPTAEDGIVVFLGVDDEESPTLGGIYAAPLASDPPLTPVALIGQQVPGEADGVGFSRIGEAVAFDGRWIGFWAAWGAETRTITLECPDEGNEAVVQYCHEQYPDGYTTEVPVHQGIFVVDLGSGALHEVAKTDAKDPAAIDEFLYWTFSGRAPGVGGGEGGVGEESLELARWRNASFVAIGGTREGGADGGGEGFRVAYKGSRDGVDGVHLALGSEAGVATRELLVEVGMPGSALDAAASAASEITALSLERESVRGAYLALGASMLDPDTGESSGGIFVTGSDTAHVDLDGDGRSEQLWLQRQGGRLAVWAFDGVSLASSRVLAAAVPSDLAWRGDGDFDGDGDRDLLWQHASNGALWIWWMQDGELETVRRLQEGVPEGSHLVGVGDVNGDGIFEILLRDDESGAVTARRLEGGIVAETIELGAAPGLSALAVADFGSDGSSDILWRSPSGTLSMTSRDGVGGVESSPIDGAATVGKPWKLAASGDFDGDGHADLVWRHSTLGTVAAWRMQGSARLENVRLLDAGKPWWQPVSAPDIDGDGRADLLWRHAITGDVRVWRMDGFERAEAAFVRRVNASWRALR